ncbi:hypothetical protein ACF0H5_002640 [Mactra antiquata]
MIQASSHDNSSHEISIQHDNSSHVESPQLENIHHLDEIFFCNQCADLPSTSSINHCVHFTQRFDNVDSSHEEPSQFNNSSGDISYCNHCINIPSNIDCFYCSHNSVCNNTCSLYEESSLNDNDSIYSHRCNSMHCTSSNNNSEQFSQYHVHENVNCDNNIVSKQIDSSNLKIGCLNVCGLEPRLNYPEFITMINQFSILCVVETKLDIYDIINVPNYSFYSKPRTANYKRKSGGIGFFVLFSNLPDKN